MKRFRVTHTAATLLHALESRRQLDTCNVPLLYNLRHQMRVARVTMREVKADMHVTLKRIREVAAMKRVPYLVALDYQEAIERIVARRQKAA